MLKSSQKLALIKKCRKMGYGGPMIDMINAANKHMANGGQLIKTNPDPNVSGVVHPDKDHQGFMEGDLANYTLAEGGPLDLSPEGGPKWEEADRSGMMKARMAYGDMHGNPAIKRMTSPNPKIGMTPEGEGTHYMSSVDNYAVPQLQDTGAPRLQYSDNPAPGPEDIKFDSPEDADYFAKYYKEIAPMMYGQPGYKFGPPLKEEEKKKQWGGFIK